MKEFEKKGNPSREPSSEGVKGLSKFLPRADSTSRRSPSSPKRSNPSTLTRPLAPPRRSWSEPTAPSFSAIALQALAACTQL